MSTSRKRTVDSHLSDADLCERAQSQGHGSEAERVLVARYMRMCENEAKDFAPRGLDVGDMESAALLGLQRAIHKFDRAHEVTFKHYAKKIVRNALRDELRKDRRDASRLVPFGLDDPLPSGEGGTISELFDDPGSAAYADTTPLRDVLRRYGASLVHAYRLAARGPGGGASEELRKALASSARALIASGSVEDTYDVEAFLVALGGKNGQLLLGVCDDDAADRVAVQLAEAHVLAVVRSVEGDETFRQAAHALDPDAALFALQLVAEATLPVSEEA